MIVLVTTIMMTFDDDDEDEDDDEDNDEDEEDEDDYATTGLLCNEPRSNSIAACEM